MYIKYIFHSNKLQQLLEVSFHRIQNRVETFLMAGNYLQGFCKCLWKFMYTHTQKYIRTYAYECVSMGSLANKSPFHSVFI